TICPWLWMVEFMKWLPLPVAEDGLSLGRVKLSRGRGFLCGPLSAKSAPLQQAFFYLHPGSHANERSEATLPSDAVRASARFVRKATHLKRSYPQCSVYLLTWINNPTVLFPAVRFERSDAEPAAKKKEREVKHLCRGDSEKEEITTTILRMNNDLCMNCNTFLLTRSTDMLLEGDVYIPKTRTAVKRLNNQYSCFWPQSLRGIVEIPFVINNTEKKGVAHAVAMKGFEGKTCLQFVPHREKRAYLSVEPKYGGFSLLGRIRDKQVESLQTFGCIDHGIIQH
ncbi:hypothetical protein CCH79_00000138, partial [Gambusia affinis]